MPFVKNGIDAGRRPALVGGGLIRSPGGWKIARTLMQTHRRLIGDLRIPGDSEFVQQVLEHADES